jgi:hypothetical protein
LVYLNNALAKQHDRTDNHNGRNSKLKNHQRFPQTQIYLFRILKPFNNKTGLKRKALMLDSCPTRNLLLRQT